MITPARAGRCGTPDDAATVAPGPDGPATLLDRLAAVLEEIAHQWAAGATVADVASGAGVSREIVRDRLHRAGALEYLYRNRRCHARDVLARRGAEFVAAYRAGATLNAVATEAGVNVHTMRAYLLAEGVAVRGRSDRKRAIPDALAAERIAAYNAGTPVIVLAARAGTYPARINEALEAGGRAPPRRRAAPEGTVPRWVTMEPSGCSRQCSGPPTGRPARQRAAGGGGRCRRPVPMRNAAGSRLR